MRRRIGRRTVVNSRRWGAAVAECGRSRSAWTGRTSAQVRLAHVPRMGQGQQLSAGWYRFAQKSLLRLRDAHPGEQLLRPGPALHGEILGEEDSALPRDELEPGRVLHAVAVGHGSVLVDGDRVREWVRQCVQEAWQRLGRGLDTALVDRDERREPTALGRSLIAIE